ncbi:hypothetical protein ANTRET_LOCUS625, partial [Anthophora retusa]
MSNPYRARPTRSREHHSLGYGAYNQNIWNPMSRVQSEVSSNDSIQHPPPIVNQSKQPNDPWNNSWNWDFDKQTDNQQQQPPQQEQQQQQQQQQQQHYVPTYANQGQLITNSIQDHYYQNINGSKSDLLNQNLMSDRNTSGTGANRPPVPNHTDSFTPYSNYSQYHQYLPPPPLPSRANSVKSVNLDQPQWTNEQQSQSTPYSQQKPVVQNQNDQASRPTLVGSNYNWTKPDQTNLMAPQNWPNQGSVSGHWQDTKVNQEAQNFDDMGNLYTPPVQQTRANQHSLPSTENKEHSINDTKDANNWSNQVNISAPLWSTQNRESILPNQSQQVTQNSNANNEFNTWPQTGNPDVPQSWKQMDDTHGTQWLQEQQENNNVVEENIKQDTTDATATSDWLQNRTIPSHHSLPSVTPVTEPAVEHEERKKSIPLVPTNSLNSKDPNMHIKANLAKSHLSDSRLNMSVTPETISTVVSSENVSVQENNDFTLVNDPAECGKNNSTEELPTKLEQLSLSTKLNKHLEIQNESKEVYPIMPEDAWSQNTASNNSATPDNIPGLPSDYTALGAENPYSNDNQNISQENSALNTYQITNIKPPDNVAQSGYDQWYSQNTMPIPSENAWYSKDHPRPPKEWST